jgi:hypothetical protein
MRPLFVFKVLLAFSLLLLGADRAMAYAGPGAGITFVNHAMTLLAYVLGAFLVVLLWPTYALLRRIHKNRSRTASSLEADPENTRGL